jgi:hypothetical protein
MEEWQFIKNTSRGKRARGTQDKSSMTLELKRKRVNNEEDLQEELDKLRIELSKSKNHQKFLETNS